MKKVIFFLLIFLFGCCSFKKQRTHIITDTVIHIDTVIQVQKDYDTIIQKVRITDTAYIENSTAMARSYYSTKQQRIVLELSGKMFNVPVTVFKHTLVQSDIKEKIPVRTKIPLRWYLLCGCIVLFIIAYIKFIKDKDR
jgi:hypothetical protein